MASEPAYLSDELELTDLQRVEAAHLTRTCGQTPAGRLIDLMRRRGYRDDVLLEAALGLSLEDYRKVEEVYRSLPKPQPNHRKIRRRR